MALKKYRIIGLLLILAMALPAGTHIALAQESSPDLLSGLHTGWMMETYDGYNGTASYNRTYEYYIPSGYDGSEAVPLLFSFHGMGSSGDEQRDLTRFDGLAEQEGFIAVFPDSTNMTRDEASPCYPSLLALENAWSVFATIDTVQWNLGLIGQSLQYCAGIDDVGFVSNLIDFFETNYNIDTSRIYATGFSDGAQFSHFLALMLPGTFAGIGPVCGSLTTNTTWADVTPLTVIMMMSTTDLIVPYDGSPLTSLYSVNDTVTFWLDVNNIASAPVETVWGPTSSDSTVVHRYVYSGGTGGTEVVLFRIEGNVKGWPVGHTWPSGPQYAPELFIGSVSSQIDGSALIWRHLPPEKYYLKTSSTDGGDVTTPGHMTFANVESAGAYIFFGAGTGDTVVGLEAVPKSDSWEFVNWTGDVSSIADVDAATTTISITPDRDYEITANFQVKQEEPEPEPEPESSGGMCFIATAVYGTSTAKDLDVLREFRDDVLLKNTAGSRIVDLYYQVSPPIADRISEHDFLRTLVRELLVDPIAWAVETTRDMWRT